MDKLADAGKVFMDELERASNRGKNSAEDKVAEQVRALLENRYSAMSKAYYKNHEKVNKYRKMLSKVKHM